jgi:hypothetical protein
MMLAAMDIVCVLLFLAVDIIDAFAADDFLALRLAAAMLLPVPVLLLVNILPSGTKACLVYVRLRDALPGCRAFSKHGPADPRVSVSTLKSLVGTLPTRPTEQNALWYRLFKQVEDDIGVLEAHQAFLLYRDMAALSLPLVALVPLTLRTAAIGSGTAMLALAFFIGQLFVCIICARHQGIRLVTNVLAVHCARTESQASVDVLRNYDSVSA